MIQPAALVSRIATKADIPAMQALYDAQRLSVDALYPGGVKSWDELRLGKRLDKHTFYVCHRGADLVGWVATQPREPEPNVTPVQEYSEECYEWWVLTAEVKAPILNSLFDAWHDEIHARGVRYAWGVTPPNQDEIDAESVKVLLLRPGLTVGKRADGWTLWVIDVLLSHKERGL
jgi:hypothetical protein